jgi:predicted transcriptional regulator
MARGEVGGIALLPIHPRFAKLIINGEKKVEFRKVNFREEVSHVVLYASRPIQAVLGYFEVLGICDDSPPKLWSRYSMVAGIERAEFDAYYASTACGVAIEIGHVWSLAEPLPLSALDQSLSPPQGFAYLDADALVIIQSAVSQELT